MVPPRQNQIRFYGLLASQAHDRPKLEALLPSASTSVPGEADIATDAEPDDPADVCERTKCYRISWAKLLARVFHTDVNTCPHCGGERKIRAWITEDSSTLRILAHWQLSSEVPNFAPARAPPQTELFDVC